MSQEIRTTTWFVARPRVLWCRYLVQVVNEPIELLHA